MATQKEQLTQQIKDTYEKWIASWKTREEVIWAMKNQLQTTWQYDTAKQIITWTPAPLTQTQDQLKAKIATGNFSASEARQYNQMTWSNTGARDIALTSQQWVQNLQTTVTPEETAKIAQAGISDVWAWVKPDLQWWTKEDFKQATQNVIEKNILQTPETTWIKWITDLAKTQTVEEWKKRTWWWMSNLENWVESKYWTIATQENWKLTAIIWDKKYQWILDDAWNPIKTEVQLTQAEKYKQSILNKYANAWVDTLYNAFVNWQIPSDMQWDLMWNPNFTLAKEKYDKKLSTDATNNQMENVYNTMTWKEITVVNKWQELNNKLVDLLTWMWKTETDLVSFRDYMAQNYPDLVTQTTDLNAKNKRLKELSEIANKNLRDIEAKYPWLTKWSAILLANKQNEVINDEMRTLQFDIAELSSNIQFQTNQANQDYNYMQEQQARKDALLREQRWMAFNYLQWEQQYQRGLEAEQRQRQFQLQDIQAQREYQTEADQRNFEQQKEMLAIQDSYREKNIPTSIIKSGNKQILINTQTGEQIRSFDVPTEISSQKYGFQNVWDWTIAVTDPSTWKVTFVNSQWQPTSWWPTWDYYSQFRVTQDVWAKSPNSKDTWWNGWTPWIDFAMPEWSDVLAITWWEVVKAWSTKDYWTQIVVRDSQWNEHMYSHLSKWLYNVWDRIQAWEVIAKSWNTWFSTWPHLDYRVKWADWKWQDPKQFLWWVEQTWTLSIISQFLKDNQSRWPWYSNDDVEAFNEKIDRFMKEWDEKSMALSFRKNLLEQDNDFKQELDNVKKFQVWLTQIEKLIDDYEKSGKSTNALKAMAEKVARATWLTTDEALAQMQTQMGFVLANYIKSISWTAASDAEVQRLMWNMANLTNVSSLNKTILNQVKANSQAWLESMVDTRMYGLPEDFKYKVFEDIYWKEEQTSNWTSAPKIYNNVNDIKKDFLNY